MAIKLTFLSFGCQFYSSTHQSYPIDKAYVSILVWFIIVNTFGAYFNCQKYGNHAGNKTDILDISWEIEFFNDSGYILCFIVDCHFIQETVMIYSSKQEYVNTTV